MMMVINGAAVKALTVLNMMDMWLSVSFKRWREEGHSFLIVVVSDQRGLSHVCSIYSARTENSFYDFVKRKVKRKRFISLSYKEEQDVLFL